MKRAVVVLLATLLILAALAGSALVLLAQNERGTRVLVVQAERFLPLRFTGVSGALANRVRVDRLVVQLEGRELVIGGLTLELRLFPLLFDNRLDITAVRAATVELTEREEPAVADEPAPLQLPFIPVDLELEALEIARLQLPGVPAVAVRGAARWTSAGLTIRDLTLEGEALEAVLTGTLASGSRPALAAAVEWTLPQAGWQGRGEFAGPVDELTVSHEATGPWRVAVEGSMNLAIPAQPGFDIAVTVDPGAFGEVALDDVAGRVTGTLAAFAVEADARASTPYGEPFAVRVAVRGSVDGPADFDLRAEPLGGEVVATGTVDWAGALALDLTGSASDLALDPLLEGRSGRLGARFEVDYRADAFDIALHDLSGAIDGRPLSGQARVRGSGRDWRADSVELALGDNRAAFEGSWKAGLLEVAGRIDAPALDQFGVDMTGALAAEVDVAGAWPVLEGSARITSPRLAIGGFGASGFEAVGTLDDGALTGKLGADRLEFGKLALDALSMSLAGPIERLEWRLAWAGGVSRGRLRHAAGETRLDVAALGVDAVGRRFAIEEPVAAVRAATGAIVVTPVCVAGADARACVTGFRFDGGRVVTAGTLERLPIALLEDYLPAALAGSGFLEGSWDLTGAGADWSGTVELAARGLQAALAAGEDDRIELPDAELAGRFGGSGVDVTVRAVGPRIAIEGAARLAPLATTGQLSGSGTVTVDDLGWLKTFDQRVTDLGGVIGGRMTLAGTPALPVVEGVIELREGRIVLEDPGVRLEQIEAVARIDREGGFEVSGKAVQTDGAKGGGFVELGGTGTGLFGGELAFALTLRGERLRATDPQWEVDVAPDLQLTRADGRTRLTGVVELPHAEVRIKTLPTSVPQPSPDVVVVGRETPTSAAGPANRLRMNVRVRLGSDVKLRALGIQAELEGELNVRRDARGQASVRGTLDITGGLLSTQGQTLEIESGTVAYNGPVGNPYIDVRAVREIEDQTPPVKVGLRIQGNVNRLTSTVFSEPAMAENRALAFLVLGRDIDQESEADSNQLLTAAINLGLSQSKSLTSALQRISGLDELSAVAEAEDSFAIAAGKRIGESIYLRYTYNTLTAAGAILISFDLTDRWRLEALSGENSAMDILYRIDR